MFSGQSQSKTVDIASLAFFRVAFGVLMAASMLRFLARGWVGELYADPTYFFTYYGFEWVKPWPEWGMYAHVALLAGLALCVAAGLFYRISIAAFFLGFTYLELIDKTNYLNHYYFISLLSFLMIFMPLNRSFSLDAIRSPSIASDRIGAWALTTLRLQVGLVYFFAGLAKLKPDWLLDAQPLKIWLAGRQDFPLLGALFGQEWAAYAMSWTGALFDLTVPFFLLSARTRKWAYMAVVGFHLVTWKLFQIGMFPWIMMVAALVFFEPDWPRKLLAKFRVSAAAPASGHHPQPPRRIALAGLAVYFLVQFALPLRHWLYPGDVCWTEEGYRFAWNVMLMEKNGSVEYAVRETDTGKTWIVHPRDYLKPHQVKQMSTQPDMILALAKHIERDFRSKGVTPVDIRAHADVSLNGRSNRPLIDPATDLTQVQDGFLPKPWILPFSGEAKREQLAGAK